MASRSLIAVVFLVVGVLMAAAPSSSAQSYEELKQQVAELTKRVDALEKRLGTSHPLATAARTAPKPAGQQEALELYRKIDELVAGGKADQARQELAAYNEKYAGTQAASWTRSLTRELEVVGKPAPEDWAIEKWFQGESEIKLDGRRTTLLIFWETWCPHCKSEVPKLQKVYDDHKKKGLQVLGVTRITRSATEESVRSFIDEQGIDYAIAKETGELAGYFNVKGIPAAAVVKNGKIVWRGHPSRLTDDLLENWH